MVKSSELQLRRRIKRQVDSIPAERLGSVEDFLAFVGQRDLNAATRELLAIPGFLARLRKAERQVEQGQLTPVEHLRRKRNHVRRRAR